MARRLARLFAGTPRRLLGWQIAAFSVWAVGIVLMGLYELLTGRPWLACVRTACWLSLCGFAAFATLRNYRQIVARQRAEQGCCVACGYDLRATPGRCPECGAESAAAAAAALAAGKGAP